MLFKKIVATSVLALAACTTTPQPSSKSEVTKAEPVAIPPATPLPNAAAAPADVQATGAALTPIADPSTVCMVNDQHMGVAQIPVQVEGKTYYGCCQMCEAKLKQNEQVRLGKDPVTQNPVDKASAVLAKDAKGRVFYFESEESMRTYASRM